MVSQLYLVWQHLKLSDISLGISLRYNLVFDEETKPTSKAVMGA